MTIAKSRRIKSKATKTNMPHATRNEQEDDYVKEFVVTQDQPNV